MESSPFKGRKSFATAVLHAVRLISPLLLLLVLALPAGWSKTTRAAVATPAPDFKLPTQNGTVSLEELRGKVVLVDFWASWCGPCRQSFPWMSDVAEHNAANGLVVVAINLDKSREPAEAFLRQFSPPFIVAFDPAGKTAEAYNVATMPSSYLVGRDGRVVYRHAGFDLRDTETLEKKIKEAIAQ
jgi:cytochrome c biogenesis protein CcmG/thiol:disulfide interchange protein DsbE